MMSFNIITSSYTLFKKSRFRNTKQELLVQTIHLDSLKTLTAEIRKNSINELINREFRGT